MRALIAIICLYFAHADGVRAQSEVDTAFSAAELLAGKTVTEAECKTLRPAVWVVVESRGECTRYYHSDAGGMGKEALVYLHNDVVSTNGRGEAKAHDYYAKSTPGSLQNGSAS